MGFSISWMAVKGADVAQVAEALGLEPAAAEAPVELPRRLGAGRLPNGWLLVWSEDFDDLRKGRFAPLLSLGPAVACAIEEHVMFQEARGYDGGVEVWRVSHDSAEGIYHLAVAGDPPASLDAIRQRLVAEQDAGGGTEAGVDMISDVPLELAESICGFKHDGEWPEGLSFVELRKAKGAKTAGGSTPGFLARLFGAR